MSKQPLINRTDKISFDWPGGDSASVELFGFDEAGKRVTTGVSALIQLQEGPPGEGYQKLTLTEGSIPKDVSFWIEPIVFDG